MDKYILIGGDILPTANNEILFCNSDIETLFGERLVDLFKEAALSVANLEGPFIKNGVKINKSGPNLCADPMTVNGFRALGIDCLSLANNHILDYGNNGLEATCDTLHKAGIHFFGAGKDVLEAKEPYIAEVDGKKIGFYSCAEYEFTIADENHSGANPFDDLNICDDIAVLKEKVDYLVVMYHGMKELYRYPAPYVQKRCRKLIDKGADLVLCQHSHCIGSRERYHNGEILYGQGNFCFCLNEMVEQRDGLLIKIELPTFNIEYIPIQQSGNHIRLATNEKVRIISELYERSELLCKDGFIKAEYDRFSLSMLESYQTQSLAYFARILQRLGLSKFTNKFFKFNYQMDLLNVLRCEAHRDLYMNALDVLWRKSNE